VGISLFGLRQYLSGCRCYDEIDLTDKIIVITGGHSGIGYETSKGLAKKGATIIIASRDVQRGQEAAEKLKTETRNTKISVIPLDLASLASVRNFAAEFKRKNIPIDVLINNAGVWMGNDRKVTEDGFEMTFGVNHLGHFLLTNLLLEEIKAGKGRVITVSSGAHIMGTIDFDNLQLENNYSHMSAYANSKIANVLFANELARRLEGSGVVSLSIHPGVITTDLHRQQEQEYPLLMAIFYRTILKNVWKTQEEGAQTTITASISPKFKNQSGVYLAECDVAPAQPLASDKEVAKKLWEISEKLVGLHK